MTRLLDDISTIAFDLDGTLVDSAPDLALAVNKSLVALGARSLPEQRVVSMVGDSREDIAAARSAGCRVAAVTYGYNSVQSLATGKPD